MCLAIKKGCKPEIAQKDILCYKIIRLMHDGHNWRSIHRLTIQPYNKVLQAKDDSPFKSGGHTVEALHVVAGTSINAGFHAFRTEKEAAKWEPDDRSTVIRLAVIPKGTEYCLGEFNEIVAVNMIVFGSEKAYQKYKKGLL